MQLRQSFNLHGFPAVKRLEENIEAQNEEKNIFEECSFGPKICYVVFGNEATVAMCVLFCSLDHVLFFKLYCGQVKFSYTTSNSLYFGLKNCSK